MPNAGHEATEPVLPGRVTPLRGIALIVIGLVVFLPSYSLAGRLTHWDGVLLRVVLAAVLSAFYWRFRQVRHRRDWVRTSALFLAANLGLLTSWILAPPLQSILGVDLATPRGIALAKFSETLPVVIVIFTLLRALGFRPADLSLRRGRLAMGMSIGAGFFVVFSALAALSIGRDAALDVLVRQAPWLLIFVFTNAFGEELLFRGLFLRSHERMVGSRGSVLITALVFAMIHFGVGYTPNTLGFVALTFVLGVIWGYLVKKTGSLWGSIIFHAGADVMIFVPIVTEYATRAAG